MGLGLSRIVGRESPGSIPASEPRLHSPLQRMRRLTTASLLFVLAACGSAGPITDTATDELASVQAIPAESWEVLGYEVRESSFSESDPTDEAGHHVHRYDLRMQVGATIRVVVRSNEFDTLVRVHGPDGLELRNDDFWDGTNSMVQFQVESTDTYELEVTSYAPGEVGAYEVQIREFDPEKIEALFALGETWNGQLQPGDQALGSSAETWFRAEAGQRMTLRITSPAFDTTAYLFAPSGQSWFNDDANDTGPDGTESNLDSTIDAIAPADGLYQLVVSSYGGAGTGPFAVRSSFRPPVTVAPGAEIPEVGYAGSETEGRMFGIYAGITDYGPNDQLFGCADDATFLAEAFRHRHLQAAEDQVVLTDKMATRANFEAAIHRVAGKAGPDDVVVIFYSGHGGIVPVDERADEVELDGTDETLVFVDEQMRDNDFARLLDRLNVDTIIVAIDACQSGGFARDIMTEPGRIGLFSSDEDVLSATAEPVAAGGYLSWIMRQAVLGHADNRPGDGAMLAGELGDFAIEMGVDQHRNMNPAGSSEPLQRILVERGSFAWSDVLWIFPRNEDGTPIDEDLCLESLPAGDAPLGGSCR